MDYEQKYKEALERASKLRVQNPFDTVGQMVEHIFPELAAARLAESEDERIKKEIISFFELPHPQFVGERDQEKWLAWIEKQGNFKMVDSSKVIEWLKPYSVIDENIVECFKKDFGL